MKSYEKETIEYQIRKEKAVLAKIEKQYKEALNDIINKTKILQADIDALQAAGISDDKTISLARSKIYQLQYQQALKSQISGIIDKMHSDEYSSIQDYLNGCYEDGFLSSMYSIQKQGIPIITPIDQNAVVKAVQLDSKISNGLYNSLGVDVAGLKKSITQEVARGIATSLSYADIARNISNASKAPLSNANRIVKTEGHRIQQASADDARKAAKKKGADVVKQWDASMDGRTRDTHRKLDGQIREDDEPFEADGISAMYPGGFGDPAEDCNCRCVALTRARWALDEAELQTLKDRAEYFGLDKAEDFKDFKKKYLRSADTLNQSGNKAKPPSEYDGVFDDFAELNLSKAEEKAFHDLRELSNKSGFEHCVILENGVAGKVFTSGLSDAVNVHLDGYGEGLTLLHSHTNATPPSAVDFQMLLDGKVDKIGVIGYNNDAYMAYVGDGEVPSVRDFLDDTELIKNQVDMDMLDFPNFFDWSIEERNYMAVREQAYRISIKYGWTIEGGRING